MSRIGRKPIVVPAGVEVAVNGNIVTVKGPKGQLEQEISKNLTVEVKEGEVVVTRPSDNREDRAQHGLARTLINNMIIGVTAGYSHTSITITLLHRRQALVLGSQPIRCVIAMRRN